MALSDPDEVDYGSGSCDTDDSSGDEVVTTVDLGTLSSIVECETASVDPPKPLELPELGQAPITEKPSKKKKKKKVRSEANQKGKNAKDKRRCRDRKKARRNRENQDTHAQEMAGHREPSDDAVPGRVVLRSRSPDVVPVETPRETNVVLKSNLTLRSRTRSPTRSRTPIRRRHVEFFSSGLKPKRMAKPFRKL